MCYLDRTFLMLLTPSAGGLDKARWWLYYSCMNKKASHLREVPAAADETMFLLMHAAGTVEKRLEDALGTVGLSLAKFGALTFLGRAGQPRSPPEGAAK